MRAEKVAGASHRRVIVPPRGLPMPDWRELIRYRDLFFFLVWRDVKVRYKQTVLGLGWAVIPPIVNMVLFSIVFGRLANVPSDGIPYPLFSYVALVPWMYFANSVQSGAGSLVGNALLTKVYFPRLLVPLTPALVNLLDLAIAGLLAVPLMVYYRVVPGWQLLALPFLVLLLFLTAFGLGTWLAGLAVQYRDVKLATGFLVQALMYVAPVVWPASKIEDPRLRMVYGLYPMAGIVEGFRAALLGSAPLPWDLLVPGTVVAVVLSLTGVLYFRHKERIFADVY